MLRISILIITFLALGNAGAKTYKQVESIDFFVESTPNTYFAVRRESSDDGPVYWLDILETVKSKKKLRLCEKWEYDTRGYGGNTCGSGGNGGNDEPVPPHNGTIHGPVCHKLCSALKRLARRDPEYPGLDSMLGLRGHRCPLKEGSSFRIPRLSMPKKLHVHYRMERDYVDYQAYILPSKHCASKRAKPAVKTTLVFFPCKRVHKH